jgi:hypothetical protein
LELASSTRWFRSWYGFDIAANPWDPCTGRFINLRRRLQSRISVVDVLQQQLHRSALN